MTPPLQPAPLDTDSVLGKTAALLATFRPDDGPISLAEIARRAGLPKSTVHRLLRELCAIRFLERTGTDYRLGTGLFELGLRAAPERSLLEIAIPFMQDLCERTHETVHLGVRDGVDVVYLEKIGGHRQVHAPSRVGGRMPLHATAIGKVLMAFASSDVSAGRVEAGLSRIGPRTIVAPGLLRGELDRIAAAGLAEEHEESATGISCLAAPILDSERNALAAISITGPSDRFRPREHHRPVRAAAAGIAAMLSVRRESSRYPPHTGERYAALESSSRDVTCSTTGHPHQQRGPL